MSSSALADVAALLAFDLEVLEDREGEVPLALGGVNHSHLLTVIARQARQQGRPG